MDYMNGVRISESGMQFGPFKPEDLYYIERSDAYRRLGPSYSTVEFVFVDLRGSFVFVEAKTSSPVRVAMNQSDLIRLLTMWR